MNYHPDDPVPVTGIYWCTVCRSPENFTAGQRFPECKNMCGRGLWKLVKAEETEPRP